MWMRTAAKRALSLPFVPVRQSGRTRQAVSNLGISRQEMALRRLLSPDLWDEWKDRETGLLLKFCTMIITVPNDFVAEVHDRMPILLEERQFEPWLSGAAGLEYLKPPPNDFLQKWPVSKRVNNSRADADDSRLIGRVELAVA
jgi:putative SOS response-associated peptidase YedK